MGQTAVILKMEIVGFITRIGIKEEHMEGPDLQTIDLRIRVVQVLITLSMEILID